MSGFKESKNNDETLQFDKFKNQTILINTRLRESKNEHLHSPKLGKFKNLTTLLNDDAIRGTTISWNFTFQSW